MNEPFLTMLQGGDRRSIGAADEVSRIVIADGTRFAELWQCLSQGDPLVRMRAADALEKVSRTDRAPFAAHKQALLQRLLDDGTEVRWHLVPIAARLALTDAEALELFTYAEDRVRRDPSRIVKAEALQAAAELRIRHPQLAPAFNRLLRWAGAAPWPSLRARARKLAERHHSDGDPE